MLQADASIDANALQPLLALDVRDAEDLRLALATNALPDRALLGRVRRALRHWTDRPPRRSLAEVRSSASRVLQALQRDEQALRLAVTGDVRRMEPTTACLELLATAHDPQALRASFLAMPSVSRVLVDDNTVACVQLDDGLPVTLSVDEEHEARWFLRWIESTGPASHVAALRERAHARGLTWTDAGLQRDGTPVPVTAERDVYDALALPWFPPELRTGSLAAPPEDLVGANDLRGVAGVRIGGPGLSMDAAAQAALREGYRWMCVQGSDEASGPVDAQAVRNWNLKREAAQVEDLAPIERPVAIFSGATGLRDGWRGPAVAMIRCDDDARALPSLLEAHPHVRAVAHPDARALTSWGATFGDWDPVFQACRAHDAAVSCSGQARRFAYPKGWHARARERGVKLLLSTDAYNGTDVDNALMALGQARRGGWPATAVVNTWDEAAMKAWWARS